MLPKHYRGLSTVITNTVNGLPLRQPGPSHRPRLRSHSGFQSGLTGAINHDEPEWREDSPKLFDHPLAKRCQRFGLSLHQPALAHRVLPGKLSVLLCLGDHRPGLTVRPGPQLLGSAGRRRPNTSPLRLSFGQQLLSLLLKPAGLLGGRLEPIGCHHPGRRDRGLDLPAGLSQHPGSDDSSLLEHLGHVCLNAYTALRSLDPIFVDVQLKPGQCLFSLLTSLPFVGELPHQLGHTHIHQAPIVAPEHHRKRWITAAGITDRLRFARAHPDPKASTCKNPNYARTISL